MATTAPVKPLPNQANGKEVKALTIGQANSEQKNGTTPPEPEVKKEQPEVKSEKPALELPPLEDRMHRLNVLFDLQKQYSACQKSLAKLQEFNQDGDPDSFSLEISDDDGHEFKTSNQKLNKALLAFTQDWIKTEMQEISAKIIL